MFKKLTLRVLSFAIVLSAFALLADVTSRPLAEQTSDSQGRSLTDSERRGKQIYLRTISSSDQEITATIGELDVPGSTVTCGACQGVGGEGKSEGGIAAGGLSWAHLVKPDGHIHPTGRKHSAFNESSFSRAVVNGVDSSGNNLLLAMPRYKMSAGDIVDLIAYLKRIDSDLDPGLTDTSIKIGLLLPSTGALADVGAAMKDVFTAYFDSIPSSPQVDGSRLTDHPSKFQISLTSSYLYRGSG